MKNIPSKVIIFLKSSVKAIQARKLGIKSDELKEPEMTEEERQALIERYNAVIESQNVMANKAESVAMQRAKENAKKFDMALINAAKGDKKYLYCRNLCSVNKPEFLESDKRVNKKYSKRIVLKQVRKNFESKGINLNVKASKIYKLMGRD